jgi:copper(I)-binding protein
MMRNAEAGQRGRGQQSRRQQGRRQRPLVDRRWPRPARVAAAALALAVLGAGTGGCVGKAGAAQSIQLSAAYVAAPQSGTTVAYVQIHNNGPADRLVSARTSEGGTVRFVAAAGPQAVAVHTVAAVRIPADGTLAMQPNNVHMIITGAGPLPGGKDVTLTLVFAHAGAVSVVATVTNSQSGGSSYFLN